MDCLQNSAFLNLHVNLALGPLYICNLYASYLWLGQAIVSILLLSSSDTKYDSSDII